MGTVFQYLIAGLVAFLAYNEFVFMRHPAAFDAVATHENNDAVTASLGNSKYTYHCGGSEQAPAFYTYVDRLCTDKVQQVEVFTQCPVYLRCPGWDYVGFDKDGKVVTKYHLSL